MNMISRLSFCQRDQMTGKGQKPGFVGGKKCGVTVNLEGDRIVIDPLQRIEVLPAGRISFFRGIGNVVLIEIFQKTEFLSLSFYEERREKDYLSIECMTAEGLKPAENRKSTV